ncbi:nuclear transport factor 2 family protein [Rhizorhabdus histidinilytica]|jgi:hypothetical protein|uniref:SnoaL-like domain-containing protein n=1 Tax=Rhizorhabdus histidinilytica TaxID=439228 RepID=A0A1T5EQV1_9SPHN|nr:nuclear transport factor 2 family protein [Rhizorhabdus histidinilytica]QEH76894.1 nuclear transport factor 2 family protein [Sphingomonas sp. C8-2]SKB86321.1 SnoaL-like domain-containing protein [Rhizorhabdus histidinilytica]
MTTDYDPAEVADRMAINDTIIRYTHALDDHEIDVLDTVFTPDCQFDLTSAGAMRAPWPEVKAFFRKLGETVSRDMHMFGMSRITFTDASRQMAHVKSKVINPGGSIGEDGREHFYQIHGHYEDVFVKTAEGWRIRERTWRHGWISGDYPHAEMPGSVRADIARRLGEIA